MANTINRAIFEIAKRSEKKNREYLVSSFANVGPLIPMLETLDNQVLYGRRGTGKTHILPISWTISRSRIMLAYTLICGI